MLADEARQNEGIFVEGSGHDELDGGTVENEKNLKENREKRKCFGFKSNAE
jgi:hypothetical protein